jgi:hypothetical protein
MALKVKRVWNGDVLECDLILSQAADYAITKMTPICRPVLTGSEDGKAQRLLLIALRAWGFASGVPPR